MPKPKKIKWLPVVSFVCLLFFLFSVGTIIDIKVGGALVGSVLAVITTFGAVFDDHYKHIRNFWMDKILPESHQVIIFIAVLVGVTSFFVLSKQYKVILRIEKNG